MRSHRLKPDLDPDDVTEVIYRVSVLNEPVISVALDMGITPEMIIPWVNQYEEIAA